MAVTKKDLLDYLGYKMGLYEYGDPSEYSKRAQDKEIALEAWCDENFYEFVAKSPKTLASEIINDYNCQMWSYLKMSSTKVGKDIFNGCLSNAALIQEDLEKTWGDLDLGF